MNQYNQTIDVVREFLDADGFQYDLCEDYPAIRTGFIGETARYSMRIIVSGEEPKTTLVLIVRNAIIVPEEERVRMAELIARANYGFYLGSFDLDMADGELVFRASMPAPEGCFTEEQCRSLVYTAMSTMDRYNRAFNRLLYGDDISPAEAVAEVEFSENEEYQA